MATTTTRPMGAVNAICIASPAIGCPAGSDGDRPVSLRVSQVSGKINVPPRKSTATEAVGDTHVATAASDIHPTDVTLRCG